MPRDADIVREATEALRKDRRPWSKLEDIHAPLVEFTYHDEVQADRLREQLTQHGLQVENRHGVALSASAFDFVLTTVNLVGGSMGLLAAWLRIKGEPGGRFLLDAVKSHLGRVAIHPAFQIDAVVEWLDQKYGRAAWRSDFNAATLKRLNDDTTVIRLKEETTGANHCLLVSSQRVLQELPDITIDDGM